MNIIIQPVLLICSLYREGFKRFVTFITKSENYILIFPLYVAWCAEKIKKELPHNECGSSQIIWLYHRWCFYFYWRQRLKTSRVQEVPRFVVMWLEEEVDEGQLIHRHVVLDADRDRIDRLCQISL